MPTGMHHAFVFRPVFHLILFLNGQCIHISAESYDLFPGIFSLDQANHAGLSHYIKRNSETVQLLLNEFRGFKFLVTQFRISMQMMPNLDKFISVLPCQCFDGLLQHEAKIRRSRKSEVRSRKSEVRSRKPFGCRSFSAGGRGQKSESEVRSQKSEVRGRKPFGL